MPISTEKELDEFLSLSAQERASLKYVTLSELQNWFFTLDPDRFQVFCQALSQCKALDTIGLRYNQLQKLDPAGFDALCICLEKCTTLCNIDGIGEFNPEQTIRLTEILERNKAFIRSRSELKNSVSDTPTLAIKDPEWLFYKPTKQITAYAAEPIGELDPERIWEGYHTVYKTEVTPEDKKRRTCILEDFTAKQWSVEKKAIVKKELLSLIAKGSDIYVYQPPKPAQSTQSSLLKLSAQNIDLLDSPEFEIPPIQKSVVNALMQTLNIPADQIAHLDTAHLKELLRDDVPGLTISELYKTTYDWNSVKEYLKTEQPDTPIFNTIYSNDISDVDNLNELKQLFTITDRITEALYYPTDGGNEDILNACLQKNATTLKTLDLLDVDSGLTILLEISNIKNLEKFILVDATISFKTLTSILENNSHLKELTLQPSPLSGEVQILQNPLALKQLEKIKISTVVQRALRNSILESSQNLKELDFYNKTNGKTVSEEIISTNDVSKYALQHLEKLALGNFFISGEVFSSILKKATSLKWLDLDFARDPSLRLQPQDIPEGSLAQLEKLSVPYSAMDSSAIDPKTLTAIFEKTVNLRDLCIRSTVNFRDLCITSWGVTVDTIPIKILKNLTALDMDYSLATLQLCEHILKHAKKLNIKCIEKINEAVKEKVALLEARMQFEAHQRLATSKPQTSSTTAHGLDDNAPAAKAQSTVDADTSNDTKKEFNVRQIFKGIGCPDPSDTTYRLEIYDKIDVTTNPADPFALSNPPPDETLKQCIPLIKHFDPNLEEKQEAEFKYYSGKTPLLISGTWAPLPSLSPREILTHLRITSPNGELKNDAYEIKYSERDNLYYIRSTTPGEYIKADVEFLLKTPEKSAEVEIPEPIKTLVKKYKAYKSGKLMLPLNPIGQDVLLALQTQKPGVGACRHRAVAFKKEIEATPSVSEFSTRVIFNVSHAFVEVQAKSGAWVRYDLGGYPADTLLFDENGDRIPNQARGGADAEGDIGPHDPTIENAQTGTPAAENIPPDVEATPEEKTSQDQPNVPPPNTVAEMPSIEEKKEKEEAYLSAPEIISEQDLEGNPFKTWETQTKTKKELVPYILDIAQGTIPITEEPYTEQSLKKILVKFDSDEATEAFRLLVQKQMLSLGKQVYYIDSPEDLICSAPWTERDLKTNKGTLRKPTDPPGDKLRKFLNAKHPNPVLVVNWSNFKAADIVRFNSLLDKIRSVDGVDISDNTLTVGLYTKKPGAYAGEDFPSRFDAVITFPFSDAELITKATDLQESRKVPPPEQKTDSSEHTVIELYGSPNWKGILLGKWCLKGKNLIFEEGELSKALDTLNTEGKEIVLKNAPWELEEFRIFWQQARLHQKIVVYGKEITIPPDFKVYASAGYQSEALLEDVTWNATRVAPKPPGSEHTILNPSILNQYFKNYQSIAGDQIDLKPGWIEKAAHGSLSLLLTRALSADQWGRLLAAAKAQGVKLNIHVAPGVSLPESFPEAVKAPLTMRSAELAAVFEETKSATNLQDLAPEKGHVFLTEDIDYTIAALKDRHPHSQTLKIIDISECEARHLLVSNTPLFNKKTLDYKFIQKINVLWKALENGKTVILKGHCKDELADALASLCSNDPHFWLNGKKRTFPGKLVLVTDNQKDTQKRFSFASPITLPATKNNAELFSLLQRDTEKSYINTFSREKIQTAIATVKATFETLSEKPEVEKYSFVKLQSLVEHQLCYPNTNPEENWQGLHSLNESEKNASETKLTFDEETIAESNAFEQKRIQQINDALKFRPFVFIAGSTGAGKSTFIKQTLRKQAGYKVFFENKLEAWAKDRTPNLKKTLFIDEANIDKGNFSAFEGLFEMPPRILIGNTYYELTPQHKVIFAGNPSSYGRETPELFARRGGSVVFTPLSPAYLYSEVLRPILMNRLSEEDQKTVAKQLLHVYQHISQLPSERILISPRELQMMALLVVKKSQEKPQSSLDACIAHAVHMIGAAVVPENHKTNFNQWCKTNGFEKPTLVPPPPPFLPPGEDTSKSFVVTKSRNPAYNQILDFLAIHTLKQENSANETFKYAGLGGMVFEGEPGVGKSHFVIDTLVSQGFKQKHWNPSIEQKESAKRWRKDAAGQWRAQAPVEKPAQKIFYLMPVSIQLAEKKKLLLKAFDEGAVVVIDEINSSPMMEDLLNDLLMGIHGNKRPMHPGFMVIGTQNPISMEGRIAASTALERRLFKVLFPPYESQEMKEILLNKHLDLAKAEELVEQYRKARLYAIANNKNPKPTFRDLLKKAELFEKAKAIKEVDAEVVMHMPQKLEIKMKQSETKYSAETKIEEDSPAQMLWLANKKKKTAAGTGAKNDDKTPRL